MSPKNWFVHIQGETFGPLSESLVILMLEQNRLHFSDFVWSPGLRAWTRMSEIPLFMALMPTHPDVPIPDGEGEALSAPPPAPRKAATKAAARPAAPAAAPRRAAAVAMAEPVEEAPEEAYEEPPPPPPPIRQAPLRAVPTAAPPSKPDVKVRRHERVPINATITLSDGETLKVLNISESGVYMKMPKGVAVGSEVRFTLESKALEKTLDMTGILIREDVAGGESAAAIEFTRVNPAHRRILKDYVKTQVTG